MHIRTKQHFPRTFNGLDFCPNSVGTFVIKIALCK